MGPVGGADLRFRRPQGHNQKYTRIGLVKNMHTLRD